MGYNTNIQNIFYEKANTLCGGSLYREAAANYLNAILIDRNNAKIYFGLGICYKHLKNYEKAVKYFEIATELKPDYFEAFYELGICHQLMGIGCGAIKNFVCAIKIKPDSDDAVLQLGISHELCDEDEMALMIYQKLIENSPEYTKSYMQKSSLLMKMEQYKEASFILKRLLKFNPDCSDAYAGIGVCMEKLGNKSFARRYYRKFLSMQELSPQNEFIRERLNKLKFTSEKGFSIVK